MPIFLLIAWQLSSQPHNQKQYWDSAFASAWTAQAHGEYAKARSLAERGWMMVKSAGPKHPGFADGVEQAYADLALVAGDLRAQSIYTEALQATEPTPFHSIRLRILLCMAFRYQHQQEVKAKRAYEEALRLVESMPIRPKFLGSVLLNFAELQQRMGNSDEAARLRERAASESVSEPYPYPRFGLTDEPDMPPVVNLGPEIKKLVDEAELLIRQGDYEHGKRLVDEGLALAETHPQIERYRQAAYFTNVANALVKIGRRQEASKILQRDLELSAKCWGSYSPWQAQALLSSAWFYINTMGSPASAHDLVEQAAQIVTATSGETSDQMAVIEQARLRLAEIEGDSSAIAKHQERLRQLWTAVHGANTKPLLIP